MPQDLKERFREVFDLSTEALATLAGLLLESLEPPPDPNVEQTWLREAVPGLDDADSLPSGRRR